MCSRTWRVLSASSTSTTAFSMPFASAKDVIALWSRSTNAWWGISATGVQRSGTALTLAVPDFDKPLDHVGQRLACIDLVRAGGSDARLHAADVLEDELSLLERLAVVVRAAPRDSM